MLELLLFALLGIAAGMAFGLIPGLHPNFLLLLSPLLFAFSGGPGNLVVFVTAMSVSNAVSDFIPSILFGAPEEGTELSVSPGHRMLLEGKGYEAVKLSVIGGLFSVVAVCLMFPLLFLLFPFVYGSLQPVMFFVLAIVSVYMVSSEEGGKKAIAALVFLLAGAVGVLMGSMPLDSSVALFPVLSGLFGGSVLLMQFRKKEVYIAKGRPESYTSGRILRRSVIFGSIGGIFAGLLPGVGTSQVASVAAVDKNRKSFLVTLGALSTANIVVSVIALWLIGRARSGASVIIGNYVSIGLNDVVLVLAVSLLAAAVSAVATLRLARLFLGAIERLNYVLISKVVFLVVAAAVVVFSGIYGLLLFAVSISLGLFAYTSGIRMSILMGVLLVPTILFYYPF